MASWTDKAPVFNPYISQQPVEAMVKVGMYKQQQYDEGLQKIQTTVDSVAGLDLIRDVDKQYLKSKLTGLGRSLQGLAGGDFSNSQLVNSVTGMTNKLVQDKNVQRALYSTQVVRKGQSDREAYKKEGKTSPENDAWWNNQVNEYLNDEDLSTSFGGEYIQYTDVDGKLRKLADDLKEIDTSFDMPYIHDANGDPIPGPDGKNQIDYTMLTTKTRGKTAQRILNAFMSGLTPQDQRQLMITGNYHYEGKGKNFFKSQTEQLYEDKREFATELNAKLSSLLITNPDIDPKQKALIEAQIKELDEKLATGLDKEKQEDLDSIEGITDIKDFRYRFYTQKHLTTLAKDLSYQSIEKAIKDNPAFNSMMKLKNYSLELSKFAYLQKRDAEKDRQWAWDYQQKERIENNKNIDLDAIITPGEASTKDGKQPKLKDLDDEMIKVSEEMAKLKNETIKALFPKDKDAQTGARALDNAYNDFLENGIDSVENLDQKVYVQAYDNLLKEAKRISSLKEKIEEESLPYEERVGEILKDVPGFGITEQGKELYSAKELFDFKNDAYSKYSYIDDSGAYAMIPGAGGYGPVPESRVKLDKDKLYNAYKNTKYKPLVEAYIKQNKNLSDEETALMNRIHDIANTYGPTTAKINAEKRKYQTKRLLELDPQYQTHDGVINPDNDRDVALAKALATKKQVQVEDLGAFDNQKLKGYSPTTFSDILQSKDVGYTFKKHYNGDVDFVVTGGGGQMRMKVSADEWKQFFPHYAVINPVDDIIRRVQTSTFKSTNLLDRGNPVGAYFKGWDFGKLVGTEYEGKVRVDVEGALIGNTGNSATDMYSVRMYYNNDDGLWESRILNPEGYIGTNKLQQYLINIGTNTVINTFDLEIGSFVKDKLGVDQHDYLQSQKEL